MASRKNVLQRLHEASELYAHLEEMGALKAKGQRDLVATVSNDFVRQGRPAELLLALDDGFTVKVEYSIDPYKKSALSIA